MVFNSTALRALPALAAACLLSVALPASPALAQKTKTKTKTPPAPTFAVDHSVSIPSLDAVDSNVSDEVLTAILSGAIAENADALAGLDAASITVPEIAVAISTRHGETSTQTVFTLNDLVLTNVVDGVATTISLGSIDISSDEANAAFGTMSAANFDIGGMLGVYGLVDTGGRTTIETIYTDFSASGGSLTGDGLECNIGAVSGAEFKARPLKTSFVDMMALAQAMEDDPDSIDPALIGHVARMYADIFTAFETSEIRFDGMSCDGLDDDGQVMNFDITGIVMGAMSPGIYPSIAMDGFSVVVDGEGEVTLDNLTIKPMDLSAAIATLENLPANVDEAWFDANARLLVPAMDGFSFAGLTIDIPDPDDEDARILANIGGFDLSLANYVNGIPSDIDISASNVQATLPEGGDEAIEQLRALGITEVDASLRLAAAWDEASETITIKEISASGVDLGTIALAGTIANASADLFALDENTALMAGMSVAVKSLSMSVSDAGLVDLVLNMVAAEQGGDVTQLRPIYADLAKGTLISLLAGVADAAKLGDAVGGFIKGEAKTLEIGITAKNDPGLAMEDFIAAEENPASLLGKVNISADAR
ncbi:hypothetical protein [Devosia faecipullorum]|uniref:hypothetical protein n=1 Tax=Devosia faecipullorum TaxID=2755039 RepID=UPI00187BA693|nr:hypothetical protein [Devosia faecipullorum]MBE7732010.1 hypothetical protein [Devosia faecipullorum]